MSGTASFTARQTSRYWRAGEARVDPALEADLGGAALPGLARAAGDLGVRDEVRLAAQARGELALRERAEAAAEIADVRVVDVPGDDVRDVVAVDLAAQVVGGRADGGCRATAGREHRDQVGLAELGAALDAAERAQQRRRSPRRDRHCCAGRPGVLAGKAERVRATQGRGDDAVVEPPARIAHVLGVDREPGRELEPGRLGRPLERGDGRPGRLGVDVVDGDGRDRRPSRRCRPRADGRSRRSGSAAPGCASGSPARAGRQRRSRGPRPAPARDARPCFVPGFARKFWTITSWTWPWRSCRSRIASRASSRSARVSPIPIRIPLVNGTPASPAAAIVASRTSGRLSGEPKCGPPRAASAGAEPSSISPCETLTARSASTSSRLMTPAFTCGSRPVSSSTSRAHRSRYSSVVSQPRAASSSRAAR